MMRAKSITSKPIYQQSMQSGSSITHSLPREVQKVKVIIVGPSAVGKSSLATRFIHQIFDPRCTSTLGAAFMEKTLEHPPGHFYTLQMWDTTGQQRYRAIARIYYHQAKIALLVYDVTNPHSFTDMKKWANDVINTAPKDVILAVVANKTDLINKQDQNKEAYVDQNEAKEYAESIGAVFHKTSAKSEEGVNELFQDVCNIVFKRQAQTTKSSSFVLQKSDMREQEGCCS